jgi:hypothetical protein
MNGILKWPLIITAALVVLRVLLEQGGAPDSLANAVSVAALTVIIFPVYFAFRIGQAGIPRPYITQLKLTALFAVLARGLVLPTYWLARIYEWPQPRFFGLYGPDVTPFTGFVAVPVITAVFWIIISIVVGGVLGAITIAATRRSGMKSAA